LSATRIVIPKQSSHRESKSLFISGVSLNVPSVLNMEDPGDEAILYLANVPAKMAR
jgi:hypothetical protein